jgi:hypothetical protein
MFRGDCGEGVGHGPTLVTAAQDVESLRPQRDPAGLRRDGPGKNNSPATVGVAGLSVAVTVGFETFLSFAAAQKIAGFRGTTCV